MGGQGADIRGDVVGDGIEGSGHVYGIQSFYLKKIRIRMEHASESMYGLLVPKFAGTARFKSKTARFQPLL